MRIPNSGTTEKCYNCGGTGQRGIWECGECDGTGRTTVDDDHIRFLCREQAIEDTGYRTSGSELADQMSKRAGFPDAEYRALCKKHGVKP